MRIFLVTLITIGFLSFPANAEHNISTLSHDITVKVNGLVCDFCARAVEKVFSKRAGVEAVNVDLDAHAITLDMKPNSDIADEEITKLIGDSGYNVVEITRAESHAE